MRTATIKITQSLLFDLLGLEYFRGTFVEAEVDEAGGLLKLKIQGEDERIPEGDDYPACYVIATKIISCIEKIKEG